MDEPKKQHYIPKFYLKNFGITNSFTVFDRKLDKYRQQPIKTTARIKDYYTVTYPNGDKDYRIEKYFSMIESKSKKVIEKINNRNPIMDTDREILSLFISSIRMRGPDFEHFFTKPLENYLKAFKADLETSPNLIYKIVKNFENDTGRKVNTDPQQLLEGLKRGNLGFDEKYKKALRMDMMIDLIGKTSNLIKKMDWLFSFAHKESQFITCDNPFVAMPEKIKNLKDLDNIGLLTPHVIKIIPLSSKVCIIIRHFLGHCSDLKYNKLSKKQTREINNKIAFNSYREVYSGQPRLLKNIVKRTKIDKFIISNRVETEYNNKTQDFRITRKNTYYFKE